MHLFHRKNRVKEINGDKKIPVKYFQHRRWQLVTVLEQLSGTWPYQSKLKQYLLKIFHMLILFSIFSAMGNKLPQFLKVDVDMFLECFLLMVFLVALMAKLIFASMAQRKRQKIYERVVQHFETITDEDEAAVLNNCADQAFIYIFRYMCFICIAVGIFDSVPILTPLYHYFFGHGELKLILPLPMDYGFDHKKYWYVIATDYLMFIYSGILVDFAYDLSFLLQIRHVEALFTIVRMRLNKASELSCDLEEDTVIDESDDASYSIISSAIDLHSECLEIIKMIEDTYTTNWLIILLLSTGAFGAALHVVSTKIHDPLETLRYTCAFALTILHFQVIFSQGQLIIDSSSTISDACYDCKWYGLPKKSCVLLSVMMMRSSIPCQLTGAKMFPLSMETFSKMLKASLSYYTVFET